MPSAGRISRVTDKPELPAGGAERIEGPLQMAHLVRGHEGIADQGAAGGEAGEMTGLAKTPTPAAG